MAFQGRRECTTFVQCGGDATALEGHRTSRLVGLPGRAGVDPAIRAFDNRSSDTQFLAALDVIVTF